MSELPTLLGSSRHRHHTLEIKKPSLPQAPRSDNTQAPRSRTLKKAKSREEVGIFLPHHGIRFLLKEFLDAVHNMDPSRNWKWENLSMWYNEYFSAFLQYHDDAEENIYFPWIRIRLAKFHTSASFRQYSPELTEALDEISELIKGARQTYASDRPIILSRLCQVVQEMAKEMKVHLADREEDFLHLMKRAGITHAEGDAMTIRAIRSLSFNSNKVVLPILVHALECSSGVEAGTGFVKKLPQPVQVQYSARWAQDFQSRHRALICSVHKDELENPEEIRSFTMFTHLGPCLLPRLPGRGGGGGVGFTGKN
eukprot:gnl/MRDRNA2_/MRDRNA2_60727_c0_seq1.p1 gnl/MRDRNA2_/MRDRNA2_60727_c0~~gnl/MRDRNA2_/MRDRNA2_60727_c0_seq1.p1  ORF type:complete len:331 (-),score=41.49 gnl/MRDRNA2_/MRDRNA2_60727_c0_seq1:217-1149(-)